MTVWSIPPSELGSAAVLALPGIAEAEQEHAKGVLRATEDAVAEVGLTSTTVLRHGLTAEAICDEARACGARLAVVGARGWGRLGRFAFGSVSQGVLELAPCPVLVVRAAASTTRPSAQPYVTQQTAQ
jgi:nucleotide-binding universal stress UspA family protein